MIEKQLEEIDDTSTDDDFEIAVRTADNAIATQKQILDDLKNDRNMEIERIIKLTGPRNAGTTKFYMATKKKELQADPKDIVDAMTGEGADFEKVCSCLKSKAFKPGASKKVLGDDTNLFWTEEDDVLAEKKLVEVDSKWVT